MFKLDVFKLNILSKKGNSCLYRSHSPNSKWCPNATIWWSNLLLNTLVDYRALKLAVCTCEKKGLLLPKDNFTRLPFLAIFRVQTLLVLGGYLITSFQNSLILKWIHSSWICWQKCSKKPSPKWWGLLVIYHGTLRKKSPTQNRSKPCKPTKSQVRTNPPPNFDDIFFRFFFSIFFRGFSSWKNPPEFGWWIFSAPTEKNPGCFLWQFSKNPPKHDRKTHAPLFLGSCRENFSLLRDLLGRDLDQLPGGIGPGTRWCSWSPLPRYFLITNKKQVDKKPIPFQDALKVEVRQSGWCLYNLSGKIAVSYSDRLSLRTFHSEFSTSVTRPLDIYRFCPPQSKKKRTPTVPIFRWSDIPSFFVSFHDRFFTIFLWKNHRKDAPNEVDPSSNIFLGTLFLWKRFSVGSTVNPEASRRVSTLHGVWWDFLSLDLAEGWRSTPTSSSKWP